MYLDPSRINNIITNKVIYDESGLVLRVKKQIENCLEMEANKNSAIMENPNLMEKYDKKKRNDVLNRIKSAWDILMKSDVKGIDHELIYKVNKTIAPIYGITPYRAPRAWIDLLANPKSGKEFYHYLPPAGDSKIRECMDKILSVIKDEGISPIERAIYAHFHIARLQPFEDGNKRLSKLVQNHILVKNNLVPVSIPTHEKERYADLLYRDFPFGSEGENYDRIKEFFEYMADKIESTLDHIRERSKS